MSKKTCQFLYTNSLYEIDKIDRTCFIVNLYYYQKGLSTPIKKRLRIHQISVPEQFLFQGPAFTRNSINHEVWLIISSVIIFRETKYMPIRKSIITYNHKSRILQLKFITYNHNPRILDNRESRSFLNWPEACADNLQDDAYNGRRLPRPWWP